MPFTPGPMMKALSKIAAAGNNFYQGGWGGGPMTPIPSSGEDEDSPQGMSIMPPVMGAPVQTPPIMGIHEAGQAIPAGKGALQSNALKRLLQAATQHLPQILSQYSSR